MAGVMGPLAGYFARTRSGNVDRYNSKLFKKSIQKQFPVPELSKRMEAFQNSDNNSKLQNQLIERVNDYIKNHLMPLYDWARGERLLGDRYRRVKKLIDALTTKSDDRIMKDLALVIQKVKKGMMRYSSFEHYMTKLYEENTSNSVL